MGKGDSDPPPPPPPAPTVGETSAQAIQAQIDALPNILAAQKEFGGQFSQLSLEDLQEFGPQFAQTALDLQREFAPQFTQIERDLSPELAGAQDTLAAFLNRTDDEEFAALRPGLLQDIRAGQSARGLGAISPLGSIDESVQIQRLKQSLKDRRLNVALSTAGRVPIGGVGQVQGQTGVGQLVQNVDPNSIFNAQNSLNQFNSAIFGTQANIFGTQTQAATARRGQNIGLASSALGALGTGFSGTNFGPGPFCWVAAEIFGGWFDPKTIGARNYIGSMAPKWFKALYIKYGERVAKFISNKPIFKSLLRPVFELFARLGGNK